VIPVAKPSLAGYLAGMRYAIAIAGIVALLAPSIAHADAITDLVAKSKREVAAGADRGLKPSDIAACRAQALAAPVDGWRAIEVETACRKSRRLRNQGR
jgi:hypothetical protein